MSSFVREKGAAKSPVGEKWLLTVSCERSCDFHIQNLHQRVLKIVILTVYRQKLNIFDPTLYTRPTVFIISKIGIKKILQR